MKKIKRVLVIGSGRWAKVYINEIVKCFDDSIDVYVCAFKRIDEIKQWASNQAQLCRIQIVDAIPAAVVHGACIAFVINSAHDHEKAIKDALCKGYHVIVEKPFTVSSAQSQQVVELAHQLDRAIFSTNTYRFATYLEDFRKLLPPDKPFTQMDISWTDSKTEERYGERKKYDSRVPIVLDIIPHVVSIFETVCRFEAPTFESLHLKRGGAELDLYCTFGYIKSKIHLSRVADRRRRVLVVRHDAVCHELDFSVEPGIVSSPTRKFVIDSSWISKEKPIANMLNSVINFFENGVEDSRLNVATAIRANQLIDSLLPVYRSQQGHYLLDNFCKRDSVLTPDIRYAIVESIQQSRKLPSGDIELVLDSFETLSVQMASAIN